MTKAICYGRFRPRPRADECDSIEAQLEACRKYCMPKCYEIVGEFDDQEISGKEEDRVGLWNAIDTLGTGYVLVAHKHDRLARDVYISEHVRRAVRKRRGCGNFCAMALIQSSCTLRMRPAQASSLHIWPGMASPRPVQFWKGHRAWVRGCRATPMPVG